jgi:hypothetical protein
MDWIDIWLGKKKEMNTYMCMQYLVSQACNSWMDENRILDNDVDGI